MEENSSLVEAVVTNGSNSSLVEHLCIHLCDIVMTRSSRWNLEANSSAVEAIVMTR